jgi:1-deoxy-D-xylulose-5-phosphate reductoisomerase
LEKVSLQEALSHPNWRMGAKVTVDCSTLMNKGLEVIEAHFLFKIPIEKIEVLIHPQSIVHGFVEYVDRSLLALLAVPEMIIPIQYALTYPERKKHFLAPFDFTRALTLNFYPPDLSRFPCLGYAYEAIKKGGSMPCFLNASNEVLVERFIRGEISWKEIAAKLEKLLLRHRSNRISSLEEILEVDSMARGEARNI